MRLMDWLRGHGERAAVASSSRRIWIDATLRSLGLFEAFDAPTEEAGATAPADRFALTPTAANSRAGRYLKRPASAPARQVTNQELYLLSRLRDVGDVAQLVLQFGEYRGATLFQVAQSDPDYFRSLALTAQRPQVRAAARQLVCALEASQQAPGRRRTPTRDDMAVVAPALCVLVFLRTLDEALNQARASIGYRLRETAPVPDPVITLDGESRRTYQSGLTAA
jgi:hypothetical protein